MRSRLLTTCVAIVCALAPARAGALAHALVVEAAPAQTIVLATARGEASAAARDVTITIVARPRDAARVARALPRYDATSPWVTVAPRPTHARSARVDATTLDLTATRYVATIARPQARTLRAFVERLETRFVRDGLDAQIWSVVGRARDCARLDARALDFARDAAAHDAREIARAAGGELVSAFASEDVTPHELDGEASRRCELGTPRTPVRRSDVASLTDTSARVASRARIAAAFTTTRAPGNATVGNETLAPSRDDALAPPLFGATNAATQIRLDPARVGVALAVIGTSARERPATIVRYAWTSRGAPFGARAALRALDRARARLVALGIPRAAITTRVRSGPTAPVNLFVDVPTTSKLAGDAVVAAIAGGDVRIGARVGESYVRERCDAFETRAAREAVASANARAVDLARVLGTTVREPLAYASRGVVAPRCTARDAYAAPRPRGRVVGGPRRPAVVATYASVVGAFALARGDVDLPPNAPAMAAGTPPEAYFRAAIRDASDVAIAEPATHATLAVRGIGTRSIAADRAQLDVTLASDAAHRFAAIDPVRAYALVAPLERVAGLSPTRVVVEATRVDGRARVVALHLDLRAPLDAVARAHVRALASGARGLGRANVRLVYESTDVARGEAAARRAAVADAFAAATREARERRLRLGHLTAIVEAEPYVERAAVRDPSAGAGARVAIVMRVDATFATAATTATSAKKTRS